MQGRNYNDSSPAEVRVLDQDTSPIGEPSPTELSVPPKTTTAEPESERWWSSMFPWFNKAELAKQAVTVPLVSDSSYGFFGYYWLFAKHLGGRVWETRGREMLSALLLSVVTFAVSYMFKQVDALTALTIGVLSLVGWLCVYALGHVIHAPAALHDEEVHSKAKSLNWGFGVVGVVVLMIIASGIIAVGMWWWTNREPKIVIRAADPSAIGMSELAKENKDLKDRLAPLTLVESKDSLRRRTMQTADAISDFLRKRFENHPPYAYPQPNDPNPSEERKAAIKKCQEYDQETTDKYMRTYKDRAVGIISEYRAKGVPVGFLEQSFGQHVPVWVLPGSVWEETPQNELGQFRELAFHVDAKDQLISPNF
jgi:hypothetical protein